MVKVTLKDIAANTGVSAMTVSLALRGNFCKHRIKDEVVARIRETAREMGYVPDISEQRMRAGKRHFIVAVMTSYEAPINLVGSLLKNVERFLRDESTEDCQYSLIMENFHAGRLSQMPVFRDPIRFHGAIISNTLPDDDQFLAENRPNFPVVLIGRKIDGYSTLLSDSFSGGDLACETLRSSGCCGPAILYPRGLTQTTQKRVASFIELMQNKGICRPEEIICGTLDEKSGFEAVAEFLAQNRDIDGLFAISDILAVGAYHAIKRAGLRIPQDIKVMGSDNLSFTPYLDPPLTTIAVKRNDHLQEAARLLIGMLHGKIQEAREITIGSEVIVRESTGIQQ